jgi:hypothetical protein
VDDAVDAALVLGAHRDHIAALALRDQRLLQIGFDIAAVHEALQRAEQPFLRHAQFAADAPQLRAGTVEHVAAVADAAADLFDDVVARLNVGRHLRQVWEGVLQPRQQVAQLPRPLQGKLDLQQVGREEHGAAFGAVEQRTQVADAAKIDIVLLLKQLVGFVGLEQPFPHRHQVITG